MYTNNDVSNYRYIFHLSTVIHSELYDKRTSQVTFVIYQLIEAVWRIYTSVNYPSMAQIMACRLAGAKPLSEPMLEYC